EPLDMQLARAYQQFAPPPPSTSCSNTTTTDRGRDRRHRRWTARTWAGIHGVPTGTTAAISGAVERKQPTARRIGNARLRGGAEKARTGAGAAGSGGAGTVPTRL